MVNKNQLYHMFEIQKEFQTYKKIWKKIKDVGIQKYINQMLLACHEEISEIMRETNYKNPDFVEFGWKKNQQMNVKRYKEEIIDLWHFVMNLWLCVDGTPKEFYNMYLEKNKENIERVKNNY